MIESPSRYVSRARGRPGIGTRIIPTASVKSRAVISSTPRDHFIASPNCGGPTPRGRRVSGASSRPTIRVGIISAASVKEDVAWKIPATPHDHFAARPDSSVTIPSIGRVRNARGRPAVRNWIVPAPGVEKRVVVIRSTPDNHFITGPDSRMTLPARRRVSGASWCPAIGS